MNYQDLNLGTRYAVWKHFPGQAKTKKGPPSLGEDVIRDLAKKELDGREVSDILQRGK